MPTRRTPRRPNFRPQLTPRAVEAFRQLITLPDGDRQWWDLHEIIAKELKCRPWEFPCIKSPNERAAHHGDELAQARWRALLDALSSTDNPQLHSS